MRVGLISAKGGVDLKLEYAVLAKLCAEMLDVNCVGVYVPGEQGCLPTDGSLQEELQRRTASRLFGGAEGDMEIFTVRGLIKETNDGVVTSE
jgi:hypothetical protein